MERRFDKERRLILANLLTFGAPGMGLMVPALAAARNARVRSTAVLSAVAPATMLIFRDSNATVGVDGG